MGADGGRDRLPAGDPERGDAVLPARQRAVNSLWQNPHGVRPAIHPDQTAGSETHAAFGRRSIPPRQPAVKPTRRSAGDPSRLNRVAARRSSLRFGRNTRGIPPSRALVSRAPRRPRRSRGFHHRLFTTPLRAAHRCASVGIHAVFLPHAPCQPGASPTSALTWVPPPAVHRVAARRSSLRFGRNTPGIPPSRALSAGRLAPTGRTGQPRRSRGFHHRLLTQVAEALLVSVPTAQILDVDLLARPAIRVGMPLVRFSILGGVIGTVSANAATAHCGSTLDRG